MTEKDWQAVREHSTVAYVLSPPIQKELAADISGRALLFTEALLRAGGVAAKGEASGIAHGRTHWLRLASDYVQAVQRSDVFKQGETLYSGWVRRPILDEDEAVLYSCGMHLLGERDIEIESSLNVHAAVKWIDILGLYLVAERPTRPVKDGEGFRLKDGGTRRVMRFVPCVRYPEDDFMFNPAGYNRLEPPD